MARPSSAATKVLLATDGSERAAIAEQLVSSVEWPGGTRIRVVQLEGDVPFDVELTTETYAALERSLRTQIEAHLADVKRQVERSGATVETTTRRARPATAIVDEALGLAADLVVVGSRGRGGIASMLLGSVAAEVVDHSPCPVLVARLAGITGLVLAVDGSDGARQAEELLGTWEFLGKLPVRVVSVASLLPLPTGIDAGTIDAGTYQRIVDDVMGLHQGYADAAVERLKARGISATGETRLGTAAQEIVEAAARAKADLVVIGSRGRTGLARLILGSVARSVLFHSPTSVLICRENATIQPVGEVTGEGH